MLTIGGVSLSHEITGEIELKARRRSHRQGVSARKARYGHQGGDANGAQLAEGDSVTLIKGSEAEAFFHQVSAAP